MNQTLRALFRRRRIASLIESIGAENYWTVSPYPTPSGAISYVTNAGASGAGSFAQALTDRAAGGIIAIAPALDLSAQAISTNPSGVVWITTGTSGSGLLIQPMPAINYARATRATIARIEFGAGITNIRLLSINIGDESNHGTGSTSPDASVSCIFSTQSPTSTNFPDLYAYGCEVFARPMNPTGWSMRLRVADNSWFVANGVSGVTQVVGALSGTTCTYVATDGATGVLVTNVLAGGTTDVSTTAAYSDYIGPFTDGEDLNVSATLRAVYSAPYHRLTVPTVIGFSVGNTVTGKTSLAAGVISEIDAASKYLYLKNVTPKPSVLPGGTVAAPFTNTEGLSITGSGGAQVTTLTAQSYDGRGSQAPTTVMGTRGSFGNYSTQGCYFHDLERCENPTAGGTQSATPDKVVSMIDSDYDMTFRSAVAVFANGSKQPALSYTVAFNRITRGFGRATEPDNPHTNSISIYAASGTLADWKNIYDVGNITIAGFARIGFHHSFQVSSGSSRQEAKVVGNLFADYTNEGMAGLMMFPQAQNSLVFGNIYGRYDPQSAIAGTYLVQAITDGGKYGTVTAYNITESGSQAQDAAGNYYLAKTSASYNGVFEGTFPLTLPTWSSLADRASIIAGAVAAFTPKAAGPMAAIRGLVDYSAKRIYLPPDKGLLKFSGLIDQAQGVDVSPIYPRKYWGQVAAPISIIGGSYKVADTEAEVAAAPWTSASGTINPGQWVSVQVHTAAAAATPATATLTIGDASSVFSAITSPAQAFTSVDNGWTASNNGGRLYNAALGATSFVKGLFAIRIKKDTTIANGILFADAVTGAATFRAINTSADTLRVIIASSSNSVADHINSVSTTGMRTVLVAIDLSPGKRDSASSAIKVSVNGAIMAQSGVGWNEPYPTQVTLAGNALGILDRGSATASATMDADIEFFWADWGDASYELPDISDPAVYARFYKDLIGADGSGVTGSQPKVFFAGDATYWNGPAVNNLGTLADFTKAGANSFV